MNWAQRSRRWAHGVLAWFVLALGVATAAPLLQPTATQIVCSADGQLRVLVPTADGWGEPTPAHALHCPLCLLGTGAAPVHAPPGMGLVAVHATASLVRPDTAVAARNPSGAPLPARGPPAFS